MRGKSERFSLYGDLDGLTVGLLREMLDEYPDDAIIQVETEYHYSSLNPSSDYFRIVPPKQTK